MDSFFINPARVSVLQTQFSSIAASHRTAEKRASSDDDWCWPPNGHGSCGYEVVDGTAVISITGGLASAQIPGWYWMSEMTYENIVATVSEAINDGAVERILLRMNSPGGTVTGCAEAAAQIDRMAEQKPIWAHCSMADSAAYWLASATNRIIVDPTGEAGSIGVIMTHFDMSQYLESWGVEATHIFSGDRKADGSPYQPLSKDAKARFQAEMDYLRGIFVDTVAAYRGLDRDAVAKTEADTYIGQLAVDAGLADETAFFTDVLKEMAGQSGAAITVQPATQEDSMAKKTTAKKPSAQDKKPAAAAAGAEDPKKKDGDDEDETEGEDEDTEAAENDDDDTEDDEKDETAAAKPKSGASSEKTRIAAILRHPEANGRQGMAEHLAFDTEMSAADAAKLLATAPKGAAAAAANPLQKAMQKHGSPQPGAGGSPQATNTMRADMERRFPKKK